MNMPTKLANLALLGGIAAAFAAAARLLGKTPDPLPVSREMRQTLAKVRVYSQLF
jgi:hypothetical protein